MTTTTLFAWALKNDENVLAVHCLLTGPFFAIATRWPDEEAVWLTRRHDTVEEARAYAIDHAAMLELSGDEFVEGPTAVDVIDQSSALEQFVDKNVPSATLDYLFSVALGGRP